MDQHLRRFRPPHPARRSVLLPGGDTAGLTENERRILAFQVAMNSLATLVENAREQPDGSYLVRLLPVAYRKLLDFIGTCDTGQEI